MNAADDSEMNRTVSRNEPFDIRRYISESEEEWLTDWTILFWKNWYPAVQWEIIALQVAVSWYEMIMKLLIISEVHFCKFGSGLRGDPAGYGIWHCTIITTCKLLTCSSPRIEVAPGTLVNSWHVSTWGCAMNTIWKGYCNLLMNYAYIRFGMDWIFVSVGTLSFAGTRSSLS